MTPAPGRPGRPGRERATVLAVSAFFVAAASLAAPFAAAKAPSKTAVADSARISATAAQVRQALDEQRYTDASTLLDQASILGVKSFELDRLRGEVLLARDQYAGALDVFQALPKDAGQQAAVAQGEGIALSMLGRSDDALERLKTATTLDKTQWRAWNALGREYDLRRDWANAKAAYDAALAAPGVHAAIVLNNRGYSWLVQNKTREAVADFLEALKRDPALAAARTNLRIALAFEGSYDRAAMTGAGEDRAAVLNNVGLAAAMRGDYVMAEKYLNEAMALRGQFYNRAAENLQMSHALSGRGESKTAAATDAPH